MELTPYEFNKFKNPWNILINFKNIFIYNCSAGQIMLAYKLNSFRSQNLII